MYTQDDGQLHRLFGLQKSNLQLQHFYHSAFLGNNFAVSTNIQFDREGLNRWNKRNFILLKLTVAVLHVGTNGNTSLF